MRCPDCNKKQRRKELLKLSYCKKCGRKHKISDFLSKDVIKEMIDNYEPIMVDYRSDTSHIERGPTITYAFGEI